LGLSNISVIEVTQHQSLKGLLIPPGVLKNSCPEGNFEKEARSLCGKLGLQLRMLCPPAAATSTAFDMLLTFGIAKINP
jgi:hypothetical protein